MDQAASVLLAFPPAGGFPNDAQYHQAALLHCQKVEKQAASSSFKNFADQLLDVGRIASSWNLGFAISCS